MDTAQIIGLVGIVLGGNGLWQLLMKVYENWHKDVKENPVEKVSRQVTDLHKEVVQLADNLNRNSELTMGHARERLDSLMRKYKNIGYIPEEEYVAFKLLGESYINAKGNHGFDVEFEHVLKSLPVMNKKKS